MTEFGNVNMQRFGVDVERRDDGTVVLRCQEPLGPTPSSIVAILRDHAATTS